MSTEHAEPAGSPVPRLISEALASAAPGEPRRLGLVRMYSAARPATLLDLHGFAREGTDAGMGYFADVRAEVDEEGRIIQLRASCLAR